MANEAIPPGMGRCELTGKILVEDELVEIQGKKVSAEGKLLLLERLKAGERMPGELERPTVMRRLVCWCLDGLVFVAPMIVIYAAFGVSLAAMAGANGRTLSQQQAVSQLLGSGGPIGQEIADLIMIVLGIAYYGFMIGKYGQTLGKMAGHIKVVRADGAPLDYRTAFIRALVFQGAGIIATIMAFFGSPFLVSIVGALTWIFIIADIVVALIDRTLQRSIHDLVAGTRVVRIDG